MKNTTGIFIFPLIVLLVGVAIWATRMPRTPPHSNVPPATNPGLVPLRIGILPERDVYAQRKRYQSLASYIAQAIKRPVEINTVNSYQAILSDMDQKMVDVAFLGSLVAVMAIDQQGASVVLKTQMPNGEATYRGVLFVKEDSPIRAIDDLRGKRVAMIRTTTAGHLFPIYEMHARGLLAMPDPPRTLWAGTHDEVIIEVLEGRADAGAAKDLRLAEFSRVHPEYKIRRLAQSAPVPENALVHRADLDRRVVEPLRSALLALDQSTEGQKLLAAFGAKAFVPCDAKEYEPVRQMLRDLGPVWAKSAE